MVLGRSSEQRDAANVDLFNGGLEGAVWLGRLKNEGVEVADDERDGRDVVGREVGQVRVDLSGQDT